MGDLSPHFSVGEFRCRHCGQVVVTPELVEMLELVRTYRGGPMRIASGYRCREHNAAVGGKPTSAHLTGEAADVFCVDSHERFLLLRAIAQAGVRRYGIGDAFLHLDVSHSLPQEMVWTYGDE